MRTIVFATGNNHKVEEVQGILTASSMRLASLADINWTDEIIEDGSNFKENAFIKANTLYNAGHSLVLSEDSGLVVEALDGLPGIFSARYAGENSTSEDNNKKILEALRNCSNRTAYFKTVVCYIEDGIPYYFQGSCPGTILRKAEGNGGFGYDPLFKPDGYDHSFAILGSDIKSKISHRAMAFQSFDAFITDKNLG